MISLYKNLKQPVSEEFPNDRWIGVMRSIHGGFGESNIRKAKESDHLISVDKWTPSEVRVMQSFQKDSLNINFT